MMAPVTKISSPLTRALYWSRGTSVRSTLMLPDPLPGAGTTPRTIVEPAMDCTRPGKTWSCCASDAVGQPVRRRNARTTRPIHIGSPALSRGRGGRPVLTMGPPERSRTTTTPSAIVPSVVRIQHPASLGCLWCLVPGRNTRRCERHEDLSDFRVGIEKPRRRYPPVFSLGHLTDAVGVERVQRVPDRDDSQDVDPVVRSDEGCVKRTGWRRDPICARVDGYRLDAPAVPFGGRGAEWPRCLRVPDDPLTAHPTHLTGRCTR